MAALGWAQVAVVAVLITLLIRPVGSYIYRVFEAEPTFLDRVFGPPERALFRLLGIDPHEQYDWKGYVLRFLALDALLMVFAFIMLSLQGHLPLNPARAPGMQPGLAFNTAVSFGTNTNWQAYAGETQASYLSQMLVMTVLMFTSAASGLVVAVAFMRGLSRKGNPRIGNFYADFVRAVLRILLPLALVGALILIPLGVVQTFKGPVQAGTLEGEAQTIPLGPVASLESIKHIGNNGGGFFSANASHPFENPSPVTNIIYILLMLLVPASMIYVLSRYLANSRQGWVIFVAVLCLFILFACLTVWFETRSNPETRGLGVNDAAGNMEGKETRFGASDSAVFASTTTAATTGSVNSSHDSYMPLGGMMLISAMMLNVIFGSCGAGMINLLMYVIFTVFIAGLMVGRTPEFAGKKIESREVKLAVIALLAHPLCILGFTALSMALPSARDAILNRGPHGITEMAYAFTSATANNGSAFAGLAAGSTYFNLTTGLAMLIGRYAIFIPMLAVAGSLAGKQALPASEGTFRTDTPLFAGLLVGIIIIVGALTFFPLLALGPLSEYFAML
jgi:potassium-transporting ATPase potassium-binding subunit